MDYYKILSSCTSFEWDEHNYDKNWYKHRVTASECEEIFFNVPLVVKDDKKHSKEEDRYHALGRTYAERHLFVVFTIRENRIRIISARDMTRKEKKVYNSYD
jgi:uncharacterized DUF497 family protein